LSDDERKQIGEETSNDFYAFRDREVEIAGQRIVGGKGLSAELLALANKVAHYVNDFHAKRAIPKDLEKVLEEVGNEVERLKAQVALERTRVAARDRERERDRDLLEEKDRVIRKIRAVLAGHDADTPAIPTARTLIRSAEDFSASETKANPPVMEPEPDPEPVLPPSISDQERANAARLKEQADRIIAGTKAFLAPTNGTGDLPK